MELNGQPFDSQRDSMKHFNVTQMGQVFTPDSIVKFMLGLRKNKTTVLEPSAGQGAFLSLLEKRAVGIEIDGQIIKDKRVIACDFFDYSVSHKFDTIIGNPPYVRYQDIKPATKALLPMQMFDKRSNLYLFFIAKCIEHLNSKGELIFITPRDFLKATNAVKLNNALYTQGSMTHYFELGDETIFKGYSPNCAIWRWVKNRKSRRMSTGGIFCHRDGQLWFGDNRPASRLGDYFDVKVGAVSGADDVFQSKRGNKSFVCSTTAKDGDTRRMIYNQKDKSLNKHKERLLARRIKKFDESNWWEWGRKYYEKEGDRIYVNCKTRNPKPFFASSDEAYDGSVLGLFPKQQMSVGKVANILNSVDWDQLGFVCGGRFLFTQRSLENAPIDLSFSSKIFGH